MAEFDLILAGGGLAAGLIAMRLADTRPSVRVAVVEAGETIGGDHIWSSFDSDMRGPQRHWTSELYERRWDGGYRVRFPKYERELSTGYASVRSEALDAAVRARLPQGCVMTGMAIDKVLPKMVRLADGQVLEAPGVIDCRGHRSSKHLKLAYQKFVGVELECAAPHGRTQPLVMDATVPQLDGYRFLYVLPLSDTRLLVEDTYYSDGPELHERAVEARALDYADGLGLGDYDAVRTETGVLPIALDGDIRALWDDNEAGEVPRAGMAAALFNPITGYSFPDAVATADFVKSQTRLDSGPLYKALREFSEARWKERAFYRLLNRMMFAAAAPAERYRTLQHFYTLDEALVERFYAGESTAADKVRILSGKPPVPVTKALGVLARSVPNISWRPRWRGKE